MQSTKFQVYNDGSPPLVTAQLPLRLAPGKAGIFLGTNTGKPMTAQLSILHPQEAVGRAQECGAKLTPNSCTPHTWHTFASKSPISPPPGPLHTLGLALGLEEALPQMQTQKLPLLLKVLQGPPKFRAN